MMNILITGAAGFVGKNLTAALQSIRDGKDRTHPGLEIGKLYLYDIDSPAELLEEACRKEGCELYLPPLKFCGDNGAMIGAQGYYEYLAGNVADMSLNAYATCDIGENK